jgi:hypothetical protein
MHKGTHTHTHTQRTHECSNAWKRLAENPNSEPTPPPPFSDMPRLHIDAPEGSPDDSSARSSAGSLNFGAGLMSRLRQLEPALSPIMGSPAPLLDESPMRSAVYSRDGSFDSPERLVSLADSAHKESELFSVAEEDEDACEGGSLTGAAVRVSVSVADENDHAAAHNGALSRSVDT